jgi:hypothetical protein
MNCREAHRLLLSDPQTRNPVLQRHLEQCPGCAAEAERIRRFEQSLREALGAPPSPELEQRVPWPRYRRHRPHYPALVAGLLLAMGLAFWLGMNRHLMTDMPEALPDLVIYHIERELHHLDEDHDLAARKVRLLLADFGVRLDGDPGHVRFAARCRMREHAGLHLILQGKSGPVTILIMPGEHPDSIHPQPLGNGHFHGWVAPAAYGSIAVVGTEEESAATMLEELRQHIAWNAEAMSI